MWVIVNGFFTIDWFLYRKVMSKGEIKKKVEKTYRLNIFLLLDTMETLNLMILLLY